jgi:hypothetical protein
LFLSFPNLDEDPFASRPELYVGMSCLSESESRDYIAHRLRRAGCTDKDVFSTGALGLVYRLSEGRLEKIDQVCSMSLICAFASDESFVSRASVSMAAEKLGYPVPEDRSAPVESTDKGFEAGASANQDWVRKNGASGEQRQIIDRHRAEAGESMRQLETLQSQVDDLKRVEAARDKDTAETIELRGALQSMLEQFAELQQRYEDATAKNSRLSEELQAIVSRQEADEANVELPRTDEGAAANGSATGEIDGFASRPTITAADNGAESIDGRARDERYLESLDSPGDGRFPLRDGRMTLGKSPDNDICISSDYVSPHHAQVDSSERDTVLIDLDTTNGTYVNGRRIRRHALRDGDEIEVGKHRFRFVSEAAFKPARTRRVVGPGSGSWLDSSRFSAHRDRNQKRNL